jgi:hypothetical protein
MKKPIISGFIILLAAALITCKKLPDPAGVRGVAVVPAIEDINPGIFDSKNLESSYVEFSITVPEGTTPDRISVEASYNGNPEKVKVAEVTSYPATVRIGSAEVIQELGLNQGGIKNGDIFTLELVTTANGLTTRSTAVLQVPVACAYDKDLAEGSYHSVSPDWNSEGNIVLAADPGDPNKIYVTGLEEIEGLTEDLGPLVMFINPATYNVTVPAKAISSEAFGYGAITYAGSGTYSSCDGSYTMYFDISLAAIGNVGTYKFTFTRNP